MSLRTGTTEVKEVTDIMATPTAASYAIFTITRVFKYINKNYPLLLKSVRGMTPSMSKTYFSKKVLGPNQSVVRTQLNSIIFCQFSLSL